MRAVIRNTWPGRFKNLNVPVNLLAKELLIKVSLRDIYFDKALSMLLGQYDIVHAFPKVRSLEFQFTLIYSDLDTTTNSQEIRRRIILFAQHIGQVVPMVRKMSVSLNCSFDRVPQTPAPLFGDLVLQLYRFAGQIEHCRDCDTVDIKLQPSIIHNLTTIDCHIDENIKLFMVLAHPVAPALQYMAIKSKMSVDVSGLVRNPSGGKYVQYACMRTLKLDQAPVLAISWHAVFAGALPFPDLRRLEILYDYPFGDDTLFRGNAATLEYLQIQLVNLTVSMLKKHRVFTPVSHPKLRRVKVWYEEEDMPSALSTTSDYLCFVLNISCNASICSFYGVSGVLEQQSELSLFDDYLHSRVLEMPDVRLGIWYAFDLIKSLPLPTVLHTLSPTIGKAPCRTTHDKLPKYIVSTYASMGKSFRSWQFENSLGSDVKRTAMCVLLLSLVCPNFSLVVVGPESLKPEIRLLLARIAFKTHVTG